MVRQLGLFAACLICQCIAVFAGEADVVKVDVEATGRGGYTFQVTVSHQGHRLGPLCRPLGDH